MDKAYPLLSSKRMADLGNFIVSESVLLLVHSPDLPYRHLQISTHTESSWQSWRFSSITCQPLITLSRISSPQLPAFTRHSHPWRQGTCQALPLSSRAGTSYLPLRYASHCERS